MTYRGHTVRRRHPQIGVIELDVPAGQEMAVASDLARDPGVRFAEPDYIVHAELVPNDPRWVDQWGLARIRAERAWDRVRDVHGLMIAVIDTGITLDHPDLKDRIWTNPGEIPNNGLDDDQNGKVDDVHGWHFFHNCTSSGSCDPMEDGNTRDDNGHGTLVAGIIGADSNNGTGIAGLAWKATLLPVKVLDQDGWGFYSDIADGLIYATDTGAAIINLSLGGTDPSETLRRAVNYALGQNRLVVAASGNNAQSIDYPAVYPGVIAVGATDRNDQRAHFSNSGPELDLVAPGVSILSTSPSLSGYAFGTGTSFAAPHVAGVAALVWAAAPALTAAQVRSILEQTAVDLGPPGRDNDYGYGRIDAGAAIDQVLGITPTTETPSPTATFQPAASPMATALATSSPSPTSSPTLTATSTHTPSPIPSSTPSATSTTPSTPTPSPIPSETRSATPTHTASPTPSPTGTPNAIPTLTPSSTPPAAATATPTYTGTTAPVPSATLTPTCSPSPTSTQTSRPTSTPTATPDPSPTASSPPVESPPYTARQTWYFPFVIWNSPRQ